jgi:hypothetical protein
LPLLLFLLFVPVLFPSPAAAEPDNVFAIDPNDPAALQEATRILAEEVKLAARAQTYVIVDLVDRFIVIKGRGAELHRLPIEHWSAVHLAAASATFRLQERPSVVRRKIEPSTGGDQPPIALEDMPTEFTLAFSPALLLAVHPSASEDLWRWLRYTGRQCWRWLGAWVRRLATGNEPAAQPVVRLTLTPHHARSLAWTVTEGMPFLIRRTPAPTS